MAGCGGAGDGVEQLVRGTVTNTGDRAGAHVVQVYAAHRPQVGSPSPDDFVSRLAAFTRVELEPGDSRAVELLLEPRLLGRWDTYAGTFRIAGGDHDVRIGDHALDEDGPAAVVALQPAVLA